MRAVVMGLVLSFANVSALAYDSIKSMELATSLGTLIASETFCGLAYKQEAIGTWIGENVDPADMGFAGTLNMMVEGKSYALEDMSTSAKTAHCTSIKRTAQHYGFID